MNDLRFFNHGSIVTCQSLTDAGSAWMDEYLRNEESIEGNEGLYIERKYADDILMGAQMDGMVCEVIQ